MLQRYVICAMEWSQHRIRQEKSLTFLCRS